LLEGKYFFIYDFQYSWKVSYPKKFDSVISPHHGIKQKHRTTMPVATRRSTLYKAILEFDEYHTNHPGNPWAFDSHALGGPRTVRFDIVKNWNLLRKLWEEKSKPHTYITLNNYLRWKRINILAHRQRLK